MTHDLEKLGGISTRLAARASKLEWKLWSDGVLWTLGWAWIECIQTIKEFSSMSKEVSHIAPGCRTQPRFLPFPMLYAVLYASSCTWPWVTQAVGHLLSLQIDSDRTTFIHSLESIVESEWLNVRLLKRQLECDVSYENGTRHFSFSELLQVSIYAHSTWLE
jgi:hypothetical protein